jgi:catalase
MHLQRDGHMQMTVPKGRVNYSPSSLQQDTPRQDPHRGLGSFPQPMEGNKLRIRAESFADHFSQARQFFYSQTEPEQNHIVAAFIFELSKVDTTAVRERLVGQLANVDAKIAERVATGLGMQGKIHPIATTVKARTDLAASPALSILAKAIKTLEGRKIGCLVADGTDAAVVTSLTKAAKKMKAQVAIIAPKRGGAIAAGGELIEADLQLAGGSSVLFDAVFVAAAGEGVKTLLREAAAVSWVHDAFAHCKVIGSTTDGQELLDAAGVIPDKGVLTGGSPSEFLTAAAQGRIWEREPKVRAIY